MIPELGLLSLIIALLFSVSLAISTSWVERTHQGIAWRLVTTYTYAQCFFVFLAYALLTLCFLRDDFSLVYVVSNSSLSLPWFYKLCAVWGGHEGSMLLWVVILSFWMFLVLKASHALPLSLRIKMMTVMALLSAGFLLFILTTSNPYIRQFDLLGSQGRSLNPLLQDIGFLFHPPMLYMGYVGFSVLFAFAIASLWEGDLSPLFAKWARPWALASWSFLTLGITLGSWWAYRELGWGGWWFWDPVENASFMPWLVGTALIHSLMITESRQQFKAWTLLLAIIAFSLSLIGTFLVRSGVLTSVHAFAVSPQRGLFILGFLFVVIGGALTLFAWRAQTLYQFSPIKLLSREASLLLNNIFLVVLMLTVLMGTIYPLIIDGLGLGKLSVGAPYFNAVFVPLMVPLLIVMGIGIHLKWKKHSLKALLSTLKWPFVFALVLPFVWLFLFNFPISMTPLIGLALALWVFASTLRALLNRYILRGYALGQSFLGMVVAHIGVGVCVIGVSLSTALGIEDDIRMTPGDSTQLSQYHITFIKELPLKGPNYTGVVAEFKVQSVHHEALIYPEKRLYTVGQMPMTDAAIDVTPFRDIYIALGEPLGDKAWAVRVYYKPFIRWIWAGGLLILLGGLIALFDKRYWAVLFLKRQEAKP